MKNRITPRDKMYSSCEETRVKLLIYPKSESVSDITSLLAMEPTSAANKGAISTNSLGKERIIQSSYWMLSSEHCIESKDLRDHLDWLLDKLEEKSVGLKSIQNLEGIKLTISCVWWSAFGHGGPVLWPEQMRRMADLDLECSFDVYFFGDESSS